MNSLSIPSSRAGRKREGPQFNRCVCSYVPSPGPRWTGRLHMAVASPTVVAFANSAVARRPQAHARWFLRESSNEADRFTCVTARTIASPHQHGTFTVELPLGGSPQPSVDYDYAGKQPIPATGLAPARYTALWAADGRYGTHGRGNPEKSKKDGRLQELSEPSLIPNFIFRVRIFSVCSVPSVVKNLQFFRLSTSRR